MWGRGRGMVPGEIKIGLEMGQNGPLALIFEIFSNRALFRK